MVRDTVFVGFNTSDTYPLTTCCHCNFPNSKNQGTKTTHFERVEFIDCPHMVKYGKLKRDILHDVDGSLSGTPGAACNLPPCSWSTLHTYLLVVVFVPHHQNPRRSGRQCRFTDCESMRVCRNVHDSHMAAYHCHLPYRQHHWLGNLSDVSA